MTSDSDLNQSVLTVEQGGDQGEASRHLLHPKSLSSYPTVTIILVIIIIIPSFNNYYLMASPTQWT